MRRRGKHSRSRTRGRLPILSVVLLLAGFGIEQASAPVAEAADRPSRTKPGNLWNAFPLDSPRGSQDRPRTAPKPATTRAFEPPRPAPAASSPSSGRGFYLTPALLVLALVFLSTVAWRDVRARRAAAVRRERRGTAAQSSRTGIRYRD
jgi:hypothetical protein